MKQESIKRILAAGLFGCFLAASAGAQDAPDAMVDDEGNLVINPGTEDEMTIAPPVGEVVDGNLVIGDETISRPDATIDENGNLVLADGTVLEVPDLPVDGILGLFGDTMVAVDPADEDGWLFSYNFKFVFHWAENFPNFMFIERLGSIVYVPDSGAGINAGMWVHAFNFPTAGNNTWIYLRSSPDFLEDVRDLEGESQTQKRITQSFMFVQSPGGDAEAAWHVFLENSALTAAFIAEAGTDDFVQVWPR